MVQVQSKKYFGLWKTDEKTHAAFSSVIAAIILTLTKLIVGIWSGSLGILSEALHSLLDLVAAGVTLFAVRSASKPADESHPYGHGRIENLSALFETILLLVTVVWIIYEAARRILLSELEIHIDIIVFGVVIFSIIIDYSRSRLLYRTAEKYDSQALKADALHFSTDILSSSVVFFGLLFTMIGFPLGDPLAAIGVAIIVLHMTVNLGKETVDSLLDRAPMGEKRKVKEAAESVTGVLRCEKIRLRKSGSTTFIDLAIVINPDLTVEKAHMIGEKVTFEIQKLINSADVSIHMDPASEDLTSLIHAIRQEAEGFNWILDVHNIFINEFQDNLFVNLHLEVKSKQVLGEIHSKLGNLIIKLKDLDNRIDEDCLNIHIEPFQEKKPYYLNKSELKDFIITLTKNNAILSDPHGIHLFNLPSGILVSFHCYANPNLSIDEVHNATTLLEEAIAKEIDGYSQIYIYVEPR